MAAALDHLVVTAPTLAAASGWIERVLGVPLQAGGEHERLGTHNALLKLGDAVYLEAIAPNPAAPPPNRPRWFGLDDLAPDAEPRLATWVARPDDIHAAARALEPGLDDAIVAMSRGPFEWLITIRPDGSMPLEGLAPSLIRWLTPIHPAAQLDDRGCRLARLTALAADPDRLQARLHAIGLDDAVDVRPVDGTAPRLVADVETPAGLRTLG